MPNCIKCNEHKTSRWYAGPTCNKCYCKIRRTPEFIKRQSEYDAMPERRKYLRNSARAWYQQNKERRLEQQRSPEGKAYMREYMKQYSKQEKVKEYRRKYKRTEEYKAKDRERRRRNYEIDPGKFKAITALRRARVKRAMPKWVSLEDIVKFYRGCPVGKEVDHIIPLKHDQVCGLHVSWNLQYLTNEENSIKKNSFDGTNDNNSWRLKL